MQFRSPNQKHIFNFYKKYIDENGYAPTMTEVKKALDLDLMTIRRARQLMTIRRARQSLVEDGKMEYVAGQQRSAVLCQD